MNLSTTALAVNHDALLALVVADWTRMGVLISFYEPSLKITILHPPKIMGKQAETVCIVMG